MTSGTAMFYCSTKARTKLQNSLILVRTCLEMSTDHRRIIADARDFPASRAVEQVYQAVERAGHL
jgi:hypothetical protein